MKAKFLKVAMIIGLAALVIGARGQQPDKIMLHLGDDAPELKYSKWIKGTPVDITKGDKIYVIELWATWCAPCIAAMPHLSELAQKYAGKAVFIGCDVLESTHTDDKNALYETFLPKIEKFVSSSASRMNYSVIADNNAQDISKNWLFAAGQSGIPCTFVVKNAKLLWLGHPMDLDTILVKIENDTYDVAASRKALEDRISRVNARLAALSAIKKNVNDAVEAKDFEKAFKLIDESHETVPLAEITLKAQKFEILRKNFGDADALKYAKGLEVQQDKRLYKFVLTEIFETAADQKDLSAEIYRYAGNYLVQNYLSDCLVLDKAASAFSKAGDLKVAAETEKKAVELARVQKTYPAYDGRVFDSTVNEFEAKFTQYQSAVKQ